VNHKGNIKFTKPLLVVRGISNKGKRIKIRGRRGHKGYSYLMTMQQKKIYSRFSFPLFYSSLVYLGPIGYMVALREFS
jgi:hypothetical protein